MLCAADLTGAGRAACLVRLGRVDAPGPALLAVSDLHVSYPDNRPIVSSLAPASDGDWLIVAGDVA